MSLVVLKFGGTSMGSLGAISRCVDIVLSTKKRQDVVVTVSAFSGVTDELIALINLAKKQKQKLIAGRLNKLEERHKDILKSFVAQSELEMIWEQEFMPVFKKLRYILTGISFVGELTEKTYAFICAFGERFSARIMHYALRHGKLQNKKIHAKRIIRTNSNYLEAEVDFKRTKESCKRVIMPLLQKNIIPVVTGFIGKDTHGDITLLGRGGTDYTASILGISLRADEIQIWSDADGIMSADPRIVPKAKTWPLVNLTVMSEMAHSGAKILHPKTITAAVQQKIPVWIKNTFHPDFRGTQITEDAQKGLRGIMREKNQMIIQVTNPSMLDAFGSVRDFANCFVEHNIAIDVCATSEVSITFSIETKYYHPKLIKSLAKIGNAVNVYENIAKICVIGYEITQDAKLLAKVFEVLKKYKIYTVSSGASFHNLTLLIDEKKSDEILKILHLHLFEK